MKQSITQQTNAASRTCNTGMANQQNSNKHCFFFRYIAIVMLIAGAFKSYGQTVSGSNFYAGTGTSSSDTGNNFIGSYTGYSNTNGSYNNFLGYYAGYKNTTGDYDNFFGYEAGYKNTCGTNKNFLGYRAGYNSTTGSANNFFGVNAGFSNTTGSYNNFLGNNAGVYNTTGNNNNFLGGGSGRFNTTGNYNNFIGNNSGLNCSIGTSNSAFGESAGYTNSTGSYNVFLGYQSGYYETGSNKLYISNSNTTSPLLYGDFSNKRLTINDSLVSKYFKMTNGAASGYMLQSDASGNASWINPSTLSQWTTSGSKIYYTSGYVGIGTSSPSVPMHVYGTDMAMAKLESSNTLGTWFNIKNFSTGGIQWNLVSTGSGNGEGAGSLLFQDGSVSKVRMMINTSGYVGIGTTSPLYKLQVSGTAKADSLNTSYFKMTNGATSGYILQSDASGNAGWVSKAVSYTGTSLICASAGRGGAGNTEGTSSNLNNNFLGYNSGADNTTGTNNNFLGNETGYDNTTGSNNNFLGYYAGHFNTTGANNNFSGYEAGFSNTTGSANNFFGVYAGEKNTSGSYNNFFGNNAGSDNTTGQNNNFTGGGAGKSNTTGSYNNFMGNNAGFSNTTGSYNTVIGEGAGYSNNNGSNNVFLGYQAGYNETGSNKLYIANSSTGSPLIYGDFSTKTLQVNGNIKSDSVNAAGFTLLGDDDSTTIDAAINGTVVLYGQDGKNTDYTSLDSSLTGSYSLWVEDGIISGDVILAYTSDWADYVFDKDYKLMPLKEVENYINNNHHLPGIPSAAEANKSYSVAKINTGFLKKIEELTLYTIDQDKKIEEQSRELASVKQQLQALQEMISKLSAANGSE